MTISTLARSELVERAVDEHYGELFAFLYRRLGNRHDAEDVLQTVFLRFASSQMCFWGKKQLRAYLYRIAVNCANDHFRSRAARLSFEEAAAKDTSLDTPMTEPSEDGEMRSRVQRALMALPEPSREVLLLRYFAELKPKEIALCLETDAKTVNNRLYAAKQQFKKEWTNNGNE